MSLLRTLRIQALGFIAILCLLQNSANAAILLAVDFGQGNLQSGFSAFPDLSTEVGGYPVGGPLTNIYGDLTLTIDSTNPQHLIGGRNRGPVSELGTFSESDLLRDFLFADSIIATVTGLTPNAAYAVSVWSYDAVTPQSWSDWTANGVLVQDDYVYFSGTPTSNDDYRFDFIVNADATGRIVLQAISSHPGFDEPRINGLRIDDAATVPEPSSMVLFLGGMLGLFFGVRRASRAGHAQSSPVLRT